MVAPKTNIRTDILFEMNKYSGKPAILTFKAKFSSAQDWENYECWLDPGWNVTTAWAQVVEMVNKDITYFNHITCTVESCEEIKISTFKAF